MKIGAKTHIFNYAMREARRKLDWSQERLAEEIGCPTAFISAVESLRMPENRMTTIIYRLNQIAFYLDVPFAELFPQDYLDAIQQKKLPRRRVPILWVREINLDALPPSSEVLMLQSAEDEIISQEKIITDNQIDKLFSGLSDDEQTVIRMRFGFEDSKEKTLREVGEKLKVSIARVRQIEEKALRKMRHPYRSAGLREEVIND